MLDLTPNPVALQIGPFPIYWYGIGYAVGLALAYLLLVRLAKRGGEDPDVVGNGIIIVAVAALIGGRLYHVIDQWVLYKDDPLKIVLPPYTGLGVYPATTGITRALGVITLLCALLYAWPRSAVLGAILMTGLLGGAIATHLRVGSPVFTHLLFGLYLGLLAWGGLFLRDPRLRAMIPLRS